MEWFQIKWSFKEGWSIGVVFHQGFHCPYSRCSSFVFGIQIAVPVKVKQCITTFGVISVLLPWQ